MLDLRLAPFRLLATKWEGARWCTMVQAVTKMDSIRYADVARRIAAAETEEDRRNAALLLGLYYRYGRSETVRDRMAALSDALRLWSEQRSTDVS